MTAREDGDALVEYLLRLGDNALILGQRLSEWTGHGPIVEEELATVNVALDLIGEARLWLSYAGEVENKGRDQDALAFFRDSGEFRNVLLVEQPNGSFADTLARQFLFDAWHFELLRSLSGSADERVAAIAAKTVREVEYHLQRSGDWIVRLGDGTAESRCRMQAAVGELWPFTGELFASDAVDDALCERGVGVRLETLREPWLRRVSDAFGRATLEVPAGEWAHAPGKTGRHTEALGYLLAEMQYVRRAVPGERW